MADPQKPSKQPVDLQEQALRLMMSRIRHKIFVLSGKGGVGKSTIAVNLACGLLKQKRKVGLLDIDIHGPSVAKMLGIERMNKLAVLGDKLLPADISGLKVVTMAFLLDSPDTPVIWRGPVKMAVIRQFLSDVLWGELDYLIVDAPPGTGDEPLTICQLIPEASGSIIVTTPQEVAMLNTRKAVRFSQKLNIPVLGIIENMSGVVCPHCSQEFDLFKSGGGEKMANEMGVELLGIIPLEPAIVESSDAGKPFVLQDQKTNSRQMIDKIIDRLVQILEEKQTKK